MFSIIVLLSIAAGRSFASDPLHRLDQYGHTAWKVGDGSFRGYPRSLAQTEDGYLWLGTEFGLVRFDGFRFVPWSPPGERALPSESVLKLYASRDGALWVGTTRGLASWRRGELRTYDAVQGKLVTTITQDSDGTIWVGTSAGLAGNGLLCAVRDKVECTGQDGRYGRFVSAIHEAAAGDLWAAAETGLWKREGGAMVREWVSPPFTEVHAIADQGDSLVLSLSRDLATFAGGRVRNVATLRSSIKPTSLLAAESGEFWIGTQDAGLLHMNGINVDSFGPNEGLSGSVVVDLLRDREGNIWAATLGGLDRFRVRPVTTFSSRDGLSADSVWSVVAGRDGSIWLAGINGLNRFLNGHVSVLAPGRSIQSLLEDAAGMLWVGSSDGMFTVQDGRTRVVEGFGRPSVFQAIAQDHAGDIWVAEQTRGLRRIHRGVVQPWIGSATFDGSTIRTMVSDQNGLWLGYFEGGVDRFDGEKIQRRFRAADGVPGGTINQLTLANDGTLLIAGEGGVARLVGDHVAPVTIGQGPECNNGHWALDSGDAMWIYTSCGLVRLERNRSTLFDATDGARESATLGSFSPKVAGTSDHRIWFATPAGVSTLATDRLAINSVPPQVHVETIVADDLRLQAAGELRLSAPVRTLRIEYTATSLTMPSRVRFRYRLEGRDSSWTDAGAARQVEYTDLAPKAYRFHVIASNNDDVWNETGATVAITITPAVYQTLWFRVLLVLAAVALLWGAYHLRIRRLSLRLRERFEERLDERTRIAQDLHDTLLQGIASTSMQLHVLAGELKDHPGKARVERILSGIRGVAEEGRRAISELRLTHTADNLEDMLTRDSEALRGEQPVELRVIVEGRSRPIHPFVQDEVYRISREAIANSLRHAHPRQLEVLVEYATGHISVHVRDDGRGVQEQVLKEGREGHWGLRGMRERAERIGANLTILSRPGSGTEVIVTVPALRAFAPRTPSV